MITSSEVTKILPFSCSGDSAGIQRAAGDKLKALRIGRQHRGPFPTQDSCDISVSGFPFCVTKHKACLPHTDNFLKCLRGASSLLVVSPPI